MATIDGILTELRTHIADHLGLTDVELNTSNVIIVADIEFPEPTHHDVMVLIAAGGDDQPHRDSGNPFSVLQIDVAVISKLRMDPFPQQTQGITHATYGSVDIAEEIRAKLVHSYLDSTLITPIISLGFQPVKRYVPALPATHTMAVMRYEAGFKLDIPNPQTTVDNATPDTG